jgi:anti-sigma28 factor (negative regulator of flagellin synthesis)
MKRIIRLVLGTSWGVFASLLVSGTLSAASLNELIVQPNRDDIELCQEGLIELAQQGDARLKEHEEWKAFYERQRDILSAKTTNLVKAWEARIEKANEALNALESLASGQDKGHLPHFGWHNAETMTAHINSLQAEFEKIQEEIKNGDYKFHVQALGWISSNILTEKIANESKLMADLQQSLSAGEWQAHVQGLGWVSRNTLEERIASNEQTIADTLDSISKGEYKVHIPTLGWIDRNTLNANIEHLEKEIEEITEQFAKGTYQIHRPLLGWQNAEGLENLILAKKDEIKNYEKNISEDLFQAHFPAGGWLNGNAIKQKINSFEDAVASINQSVSEGTYQVPVADHGWLNRKQIHEILSRKGLTADAIKKLNKGLEDIQTASALDAAIYMLDKSVWTSWIGELLKFAKPWLESKQLDIDQFTRHQGDFSEEKAFLLKQKERELAHLKECLSYIP